MKGWIGPTCIARTSQAGKGLAVEVDVLQHAAGQHGLAVVELLPIGRICHIREAGVD